MYDKPLIIYGLFVWIVCIVVQDLQTVNRNEEATIKDNIEHMRQVLAENHKAMDSMVHAMKSMQVY